MKIRSSHAESQVNLFWEPYLVFLRWRLVTGIYVVASPTAEELVQDGLVDVGGRVVVPAAGHPLQLVEGVLRARLGVSGSDDEGGQDEAADHLEC